MVQAMIDAAVEETRPDLTLLMVVAHKVSAERLLTRQATMPFMRDRIEEADRSFFERVAKGYQAIAAAEPNRVRQIDANGPSEWIEAVIWGLVEPLLPKDSVQE
jgi:dTMP kinase